MPKTNEDAAGLVTKHLIVTRGGLMIEFKTPKVRDDYTQLGTKNPALLELLIDLAECVQLMFKKPIVLTSVHRNQAEQDALYAAGGNKAPKSAHSTWEAVDLRDSIYTKNEIDFIVNYLNTKYKNANGKKVALHHKIAGNVAHFHVALYRATS